MAAALMLMDQPNMPNPDDKRALFGGELAVKTETDRPGETLLVTFGGLSQGIAMPPFDFYRIVRKLPAKLAFFRDVSQTWYHGDLPGVGHGIGDVAKAVIKLKEESGAKRLVCVGNSMGGYAALTVGSLAKADEVLAFAPQTCLSRWLVWRIKEKRAKEQFRNLWKSGASLPNSLDLKKFLSPPGWGKAQLFADRSHPADHAHVSRLADKANTEIHWFDDGAHNLIKKLHRQGEFKRLLAEACNADWEDKK